MTTAEKKATFRAILVALAIALVSWGAVRYDASKMDTQRFVTDSSSRQVRDSLRDATLRRIDERVGKILCASLPQTPLGQAGC